MIRKNICLLMALVLVLSLMAAGCGTGAGEETEAAGETTQEITETTEAPTEETAEETTESMEKLPARNLTSLTLEPSEDITVLENVQAPGGVETTTMSADTEAEPNAIKGENDPVQWERPWYDLGSCAQLEGNVLFMCIFMNDNESSWTYTEMDEFLNEKAVPAMQWIVDMASYYEADLTCTVAYYTEPVYCSGSYGDFNAGTNPYILYDASDALGYGSLDDMQMHLKELYGVEQVAFMVCIDKPGRCYASIDQSNDNYYHTEYCVLFDDAAEFNGLYYACYPSTVAHELIHLFGAEDFYADGSLRNGRAALADEWFYNGIMLRTYTDISYNWVDPVTAYAIGWRDISHVVLYEEAWWN